MIELIQFPWSPYCLVQRQILAYGRIPCRVINIPNGDRSLVWKITKERYYHVPVLRNGRSVIFETGENSQVIAKYLDDVFDLELFPEKWVGVQDLLWPYIEGEIEGLGFKLNDIYWKEFVPKSDRLRFMRHKERKFGRGCLELWQRQQKAMLAELDERLLPFEQMLKTRPFLLDETPRFLDFDLYGMLANFLFSGHYTLPPRHRRLQSWYERVRSAKR